MLLGTVEGISEGKLLEAIEGSSDGNSEGVSLGKVLGFSEG
jgi:hypothetical protein